MRRHKHFRKPMSKRRVKKWELKFKSFREAMYRWLKMSGFYAVSHDQWVQDNLHVFRTIGVDLGEPGGDYSKRVIIEKRSF